MKFVLGMLVAILGSTMSQAQDVQAMARAMRENMPPGAKCAMSNMTGKPGCVYEATKEDDYWYLTFSGGSAAEPDTISAQLIVRPPDTEGHKQLRPMFLGFLDKMGFDEAAVRSCFGKMKDSIYGRKSAEVVVGARIGTCVTQWNHIFKEATYEFEIRRNNRF
jgi:hypothetical protein